MAGRNLRVILNGGKAPDKRLETGLKAVRRRGHVIDVSVTGEAIGAAALAKQAAEEGVDVIVAGGGDGTVNEVASGLFAASAEPDVTMAVLPLGSANDFAHSCNIPTRDVGAALLWAADSEPTEIDVGYVNGRYFLNGLIIGFGAEATFRTPALMKFLLGSVAYRIVGTFCALHAAAYPIRVRTGEGVDDTTVSLVAVMNGRWAGGARLAARARLNDGLLDLLTVPACSVSDLPSLAVDLHAMPNRDPSFVRYEQHEWVEIEAGGNLPVSPDGEWFQGSSLRINVLKRRLPFALPPTDLV